MNASAVEDFLAALANSTAMPDATTMPPPPSAMAPAASDALAPGANVSSPAEVQAFIDDFRYKMHLLQIFVVLGYALMCSLSVALACYLRYNRNVALKGDVSAARKILLPAFEPLIWILALSTGIFSVTVTVTLAMDTFRDTVTPLASEAFYSGRMFVILLVVVYMMQKSVTVPALIRSVGISLVGGTYTLLVELLLSNYDDNSTDYARVHHVVMLTAKSLLLAFFTYVFVYPPGRASPRTIREYVAFVYVYYICVFAYTFLLYEQKFNGGFTMVYATTMWAALVPLFIWRVLKADTEHWRGMGERAVALQSLFRQKHNLNERVSSQGLHVLIEMHRKFIIDFAYLELKHKIGVGSTAVVFNGVLNSKTPVAVKVYTPSEYHEETVAEFSQEAALCGALNHPNIVKFYGMCVCPPTICLVSELCQGSLDDVTSAIANSKQHQNRQQHLINVAYMIDAARAVAYIHSFSPAFVHRDIKPSNFLVDVQNTVKLTDFGESRSLPKTQMMTTPLGTVSLNAAGSTHISKRLFLKSGASLQSGRQSSVVSDQPAQLTVKGTVDYMAPEIIQGRAGVAQYGEAADVYSLAITMWDILHPGKEKFPTIRNNHLHIFESVIEGKRPALEEVVHPGLRAIIESAWHSDPRLRPSAQNIVNILESIQEELFAVFAIDLMDEIDQEPMFNKYGELLARTFSAQQASDRMEELCFVNSEAEAMRLGNALMDAGLLHHCKHERPYEPGEGLYFFDEDNINLCRPLLTAAEYEGDNGRDIDEDEQIDHLVPLPHTSAVLGGRSSSTRPTKRFKSQRRKNSSSHSISHTIGRTIVSATRSEMATTIYDNGICQCRKLGQRLEQPKAGMTIKRRGFRRHRNKAASEENILTAKLLGVEQGPLSQTNGDFDDFEAVSTDFLKHHDDDGSLA